MFGSKWEITGMKTVYELTCRVCPCRHEDICLKAGYNNGQEFGDKLRREISKHKQENKEIAEDARSTN